MGTSRTVLKRGKVSIALYIKTATLYLIIFYISILKKRGQHTVLTTYSVL